MYDVEGERKENPPAPKVPGRGSLAASETDRSVRLMQLQLGGPCSPGTGHQKAHGTVVICTFCRSAQHRSNGPCRSNMAATLARLGVNFGQQGPQLGPIGPNFGPTWHNLAPTWTHLGARSIRLQNGGHSRPNPKSSKRPSSLVFISMFLCYR